MAIILVIDTDPTPANPLGRTLSSAGFQVVMATTSTQALAVVRRQPVDLVVLDLDLLADAICQLTPAISLLVLSATQRRSADSTVALERGADAYLVRPVTPQTLLAYVRALLRRPRAATRPDASGPPQVLQLGALTIDPARHTVWVGPAPQAAPVALNRSEFAVLLALARRVGQVLSPAELLDQIWGPAYAGDDRAVYVRIYQIRKKLGAFPDAPQIETIPRCSYRLTLAPVHPAPAYADPAS